MDLWRVAEQVLGKSGPLLLASRFVHFRIMQLLMFTEWLKNILKKKKKMANQIKPHVHAYEVDLICEVCSEITFACYYFASSGKRTCVRDGITVESAIFPSV